MGASAISGRIGQIRQWAAMSSFPPTKFDRKAAKNDLSQPDLATRPYGQGRQLFYRKQDLAIPQLDLAEGRPGYLAAA